MRITFRGTHWDLVGGLVIAAMCLVTDVATMSGLDIMNWLIGVDM